MHRCLQLAGLAAGKVAPNPMVGALLVHEGTIIGEGYHSKFGGAHAEVNCINSVQKNDLHRVPSSTLYVSLEPCSHFGKTPPCTDLIIKHTIPKVVIGCKDVYKEVQGKGIQKLQEAGIEVIKGVLEKECIELNKRFFTFHQKQRPFIILKWAESRDGKIAAIAPSPSIQMPGGGDVQPRTFISNDYSNRLVHKWRSEEQAILAGKQTVLKDDPSLTTRLWPGENPIRCVIDNNLTLPMQLKIFDGESSTLVFNQVKDDIKKNIKWVKLINGELSSLLSSLYQQKILSVLVEGGALLLQSFIDAGLWDEARIIRNDELLIGSGLDSPVLKNSIAGKTEKYFSDSIHYFQHSF